MTTSPADVLKLIKDKEVKFVDLRFTDTRGKEQHVSVPAKVFDNDKFESGHAFDGSSIAGWKGIQASDMLLMPDPTTANLDPFLDETTLLITCDVVEPTDGKGYERDPRSLAKRAESYLKSTGLGDYLKRSAGSFDVAHLHACRNLPGVIAARHLRRGRRHRRRNRRTVRLRERGALADGALLSRRHGRAGGDDCRRPCRDRHARSAGCATVHLLPVLTR